VVVSAATTAKSPSSWVTGRPSRSLQNRADDAGSGQSTIRWCRRPTGMGASIGGTTASDGPIDSGIAEVVAGGP